MADSGGCCSTENVVFLQVDKSDKNRSILNRFVRACAGAVNVNDMMITRLWDVSEVFAFTKWSTARNGC